MPSKRINLYIIHGWTYHPEPWEEVIRELHKRGINAILLKVPGLATPSRASFTIDDYVAWAAKNIEKGSLVLGHSNGGRILLNLLSRPEYQDFVSGLILLDSAGIYEFSTKREVAGALSKTLSPLKKIPPLRKLTHRVLGAHDYAKAPENMKKTLANMLASDKALDPSKVKVKTAIIWGSADNITPLRQGKKLHQLIKNSTFTLKDGWAHSHYLKSPFELAGAIAKAYHDLISA